MSYRALAGKILGYCSMGIAAELPEEQHLDSLENALIDLDDEVFNTAIENAKTTADYLAIKIPDNDIIKYYMSDGKENNR